MKRFCSIKLYFYSFFFRKTFWQNNFEKLLESCSWLKNMFTSKNNLLLLIILDSIKDSTTAYAIDIYLKNQMV